MPSAAGIGLFDDGERRLAVLRETAALRQALGSSANETKALAEIGVLESYLAVHHLGRYSIMQGAERAAGIDDLVVTDFFHQVGRRIERADGVEAWTFPMGGYFNGFRKQGVTAGLLGRVWCVILAGLREGADGPASATAIASLLTDGVASLHGDALPEPMRDAFKMQAWFMDPANEDHWCVGQVVKLVRGAAKVYFASLYAPGGELHRPGKRAPTAADFH